MTRKSQNPKRIFPKEQSFEKFEISPHTSPKKSLYMGKMYRKITFLLWLVGIAAVIFWKISWKCFNSVGFLEKKETWFFVAHRPLFVDFFNQFFSFSIFRQKSSSTKSTHFPLKLRAVSLLSSLHLLQI